jgi:hypothetical protein
VKHLAGGPLKGRLLALPTKATPGWKGLPGTNTLAHNVNYERKEFYNIEARLGSEPRSL